MKTLAVEGGVPLLDSPQYVGRPFISNREAVIDQIDQVLESKWVTNDGKYVKLLEEYIEATLGVKHCILVANGTLGIQLALMALVPKYSNILMPSFTFIATAHAATWQSYRPTFVDVEEETHNISIRDCHRHMNEQIGAILAVNLWGNPCDIRQLNDISDTYDIPIIYDSSHAFMSEYKTIRLGRYGACEIFSLHATKMFSSVEGGAITTDNDKLAIKLRQMRNFGFRGDNSPDVVRLGINAKMSELHAIVGLHNILCMTDIQDKVKATYLAYVASLDGSPLPPVPMQRGSNCQYPVFVLDTDMVDISADELCHVLNAENVYARRYFSPPCHMQMPYRNVPYGHLPVTDKLAATTIVLPNGSDMTTLIAHKIGDFIREYLRLHTK